MEKSQSYTSKYTGKGFVFSLDAFLALIIAFLFIGLIVYNPFEENKNVIARIEGQRQANDLLDLMDRKEILGDLDLDRIEQEMDSALSEQYDWTITITEYTEESTLFSKTGTSSIGNTAEDLSEKDVIKGNRIFLSFDGKEIDKYYVAEYWLWLK